SEEVRVGGQVEETVARQVPLRFELLKASSKPLHPLRRGDVGALVEHLAQKSEQAVALPEQIRPERGNRLLHIGTELVMLLFPPAHANDREAVGEELAEPEAVECGQQLSRRQVAGSPENDEGERVRKLDSGDK